MNPLPKAVVTGILFLLLVLIISAEESTGVQYKLKIITSLNILNSTKSALVFNGDVIFQSIANDAKSKDNINFKTSYNVAFRKFDVFIKSTNSNSINLSKCETFHQIKNELEKPFVANYVNGLFENIHVSKDESDLSANLKLYTSMIVSVDAALLLASNETEFSSQSKQNTLFGNCNVTYKVKKRINQDGLNFHINKIYDKDCNGICQGNTVELDKSCNIDSELQSKWVNYENMEVVYGQKLKTVTKVHDYYNLNYKPWKDSVEILGTRNAVLLDRVSIIKSSLVTNFNSENSKILTKPQLNKLNSDLIEEGKKTEGIQKIYRALACAPFGQTIYLDIYEQASICKKSNKTD